MLQQRTPHHVPFTMLGYPWYSKVTSSCSLLLHSLFHLHAPLFHVGTPLIPSPPVNTPTTPRLEAHIRMPHPHPTHPPTPVEDPDTPLSQRGRGGHRYCTIGATHTLVPTLLLFFLCLFSFSSTSWVSIDKHKHTQDIHSAQQGRISKAVNSNVSNRCVCYGHFYVSHHDMAPLAGIRSLCFGVYTI